MLSGVEVQSRGVLKAKKDAASIRARVYGEEKQQDKLEIEE